MNRRQLSDESTTTQHRDAASATLKLRDDLIFRAELSGDRPGYAVEDPLRGKFYRLGTAEAVFLKQLDGQRSIADAIGAAAIELGALALREAESLALCHWAVERQLAQPIGGEGTVRIAAAAVRNERKKFWAMANPLCIRIPLLHPDRWLTKILPWCRWIFTAPMVALCVGMVGYALYLVGVHWSQIEVSAAVILDRENWLRLVVAWVLLKVIHETAHGLACKHFGGTVGSAGIALLFFMPLAYVDVTSSWRFASKWQRIITAAAGVYAELFIATAATVVWANTSPGILKSMSLNLALTAGVSTVLFNANPLVRFDGYFILSDFLELPNLYSLGQQCVSDCIQKYGLGLETAAPERRTSKKWLIALYALSAMFWRILFFITIALVLVGFLGPLGTLLAVLLLGFAWAIPVARMVRQTVQLARGQPFRARRVATSVAVVFAVMLLLGVSLTRPGLVTAPAVVEYAPLNIVRTSAPGFVDRLLVASGDPVVQGQPIAILRNDELNAELTDLELACRASMIKSCMFAQAHELAKLQVEAADRAAIEKKIAETRSRVASLTICAGVSGRVYARDFDSMLGRYLHSGDEIAIIGCDEAKELVVAVRQDDVDLFAKHLCEKTVCARTSSGTCVTAGLTMIDPRGSSQLPHAALSATVGGPLAVTPVASEEDSADNKTKHQFELTSPVFQAKAVLDADASRQLYAGQVVPVSFRTSDETIAMRVCRSVERWVARNLHASRPG